MFVLYIWVCFFFVIFTSLFYFLDSKYKWYHIVLVFLSLISLRIMPSKFIHVVVSDKISFFFVTEVVFHCVYIPHLLYPLICWYHVNLQFSHSVVSDSLQLQGLRHARLPCPSPTPGARSNSCPSSQWCHPTISSSVVAFSSCFLSFPASGSFLKFFFSFIFISWRLITLQYCRGKLVSSSHQVAKELGVSASASVLPMVIQDWFPSGLTGLILVQSRELSLRCKF